MRSNSRVRSLLRLLILGAPIVAAACLGGRGSKRPAATPPTPVVRPDSGIPPVTVPVVTDTGKAVAPPDRDSLFKVADSLKKALLTDSAKAAVKGGKTPPKKKATKECLLDTHESPETARFTFQQQNDSTVNFVVGGGFVGRCTGEKNTLKADSAEYYEATGYVNLFGNVTYEERGEFRVTANHANYFVKDGKLFADGNVNARQLKSGSFFVGPNIEYDRVMPDIRDVSRMYAPNSPTVQILQKDSTGKELPPVKITSNVMQDTGDSLLVAWGNVNILRTDITGRSDSASFHKPSGNARLVRLANIQSTTKDQPFTLAADTIDMFTQDQILNRVLAKHGAKAKSGETTMSAERLDMVLVDRKIDRAYVYGPGRAKADTKAARLEADSMDIRLPNQKIRELRAFGRAVALNKPDTMKIRSAEDDVLRGDSIFADFDTLADPTDTAKVQIKRVSAMGNAASKVQIAARQGREFPPAINYLRGKNLVVRFDSGTAREVAADSSASGGYYEPIIDTLVDTTGKAKPRKPPPPLAAMQSTRETPAVPGRTPHNINAIERASVAILPTRTHRAR